MNMSRTIDDNTAREILNRIENVNDVRSLNAIKEILVKYDEIE